MLTIDTILLSQHTVLSPGQLFSITHAASVLNYWKVEISTKTISLSLIHRTEFN